MPLPAALDAFDRLAVRRGTATYVAVLSQPALPKEMGVVSGKITPEPPLLQRGTNNPLARPEPEYVPLQVRGDRIYHGGPPPVFVRGEIAAGENSQVLAPAKIDPSTHPRHIVVPDQAGLARSCSVEIQLLTFRCCIGGQADPRQVRFAMCAGRRQGMWKCRIWRLPWSGDTAPFLQIFRKQWQLVAAFHWGVSSREIAQRLVTSVDSVPAEIPGLGPEIDEWDAGARRFVSGRPDQLRMALEKESGRLAP